MEVGGTQSHEGGAQVEQALARGLSQHTERAGDPEVSPARCSDAGAVVYQEQPGAERVRQRDRGALARVQPRQVSRRLRRITSQDGGQAIYVRTTSGEAGWRNSSTTIAGIDTASNGRGNTSAWPIRTR